MTPSPLALFELRVQLRRASYRAALLVLMVPTTAAALLAPASAGSCFGYAYLISLAFRLNIATAEERQSGQALLMSNFAPAGARMLAKLAGLLARETLFLLATLLLASLAWRSIPVGCWYAVEFTLVACLVLPFAVIAELLTGMRAAGALALLLAAAAVAIAMHYSDPASVLLWVGMPQLRGAFSAFDRMAVVAGACVLISLMACGMWVLASPDTRT